MSVLMSETNPLHLLHNTVKSYEKDAAAFYISNEKATSKFAGRFDFKQFAKKIFDPIETEILGDLYVKLLEESHQYMHLHQKSRVGAQGFPHSFVSVPELLLNMILAYQLPQQKFVPFEKESKESKEGGEEKSEEKANGEQSGGSRKKRRSGQAAKKGKNVTVNPRVTLTTELSLKLLEEMLKIPLAAESKMWKTAKYVLCPSNCPKQLELFGEIIAQNTRRGLISFNALTFFMHDQTLNRYLEDPITILHALYIGPLNAQTVEVFAANRSDDFRQNCREVLRTAVHASKDPMTFKLSEPDFISKSHPDHVNYRDFVETVNQLIRDLNGEYQGSSGIHTGWACAAIKKFGQKRYVDKTWKDENYYDLIWTVLAQRPHLKKFVVDVLEKNYKDYAAAKFWRKMQPYQMNPTIIFNQNVIREDPLKPTEDFLNFPPKMSHIYMVSTEKEMRDFHMLLEYKVSREGVVHAGVDAEWSAYVSPSRATILQVAFYDCTYIIDLESHQISFETYNLVLSYLFWTPEIIKIGFQFAEDLHQLRAAFRNCAVLYKPNNVICVGKLVMDLMDEIGKMENSEEIKRDWLPFLIEDSSSTSGKDSSIDESVVEENNHNESISNESVNEGPSNEGEEGGEGGGGGDQKPVKEETVKQQFLNKGLSFMCEKLLGRPLDKTEQCSVWDRRPLRCLQLRYAAMDAYCMLMLFEKCEEVYSKIGLDVKEFLKKQSPIRISLPLLSEEKL
uniref:3'-5' exonuclease domain-containing protein n=1 Tax=Caenorhabditis tropicalis TaxID=1561998 RepID=A0A1I7TFQ9_9PELO